MGRWRGLQAVFDGTKQNVVASSGYACLIWGVGETGPRGGEGGARSTSGLGGDETERRRQRREGEKRGLLGARGLRGRFPGPGPRQAPCC